MRSRSMTVCIGPGGKSSGLFTPSGRAPAARGASAAATPAATASRRETSNESRTRFPIHLALRLGNSQCAKSAPNWNCPHPSQTPAHLVNAAHTSQTAPDTRSTTLPARIAPFASSPTGSAPEDLGRRRAFAAEREELRQQLHLPREERAALGRRLGLGVQLFRSAFQTPHLETAPRWI